MIGEINGLRFTVGSVRVESVESVLELAKVDGLWQRGRCYFLVGQVPVGDRFAGETITLMSAKNAKHAKKLADSLNS